MKKKRIDKLENSIADIEPEHEELMELYVKFEQALEDGNNSLARELRTDAEPWLKDGDRFTKLAYFPPDNVVPLEAWHQFVKYNFGLKK